ncbi:MAG TPA: hypothetical protein VFP98_10655, partial [Candidatus Polarisedimenticolia bacterium]|nr:hypothetical protein [Candidatus Polarisedimenticolia bacterium]
WLHNNLRYHHYEIEGETEQDLDNVIGGVPTSASEDFMRLTDWTAWEGRTEVEWRINRSWGVRGGYRRLDRDVRTEARTDGALTAREEADQAADTFFGGVSYRHDRKFSAHAEFWDGEYDNVFVRVQPADFMLGRFRATFRPGDRWAINLSASYRQAENPTPDFANKVNSRTYSASLDYNGTKLTTSTGYSAVNLDSSTDIAFCTGGTCTGTTLVTDVSLWEFADNHVYTNTSYAFSDRIRGSVRARLTDSRDTFPVEYTYVEPRIAVRLFSGYWVNVGWYKYEFDRDDDDTQDYRAYGALLTFSGEF